MPYVVFALKWRPKNFDEVIGQKHIVTTLKNALESNRLAHAYLFAGPRGVGKTSTARILAKSLNCKDGPTLHPCQVCASCMEISQGRNMDVMEIDGASNRGIDEIRTLRENVKFAPTQGRYKVYIIDEVHQITPDGFNALLKTLEEPPPYVKFIFATTQPNKVIPTILSRCQRLDFRRITVMEIIEQLEKIVAAEKIEIEKEVLVAIAKSSDGSLRDAESILDQLISFSKDKLSLKDIVSMLGIVEQDVLFEIADKIIQKDAKSALTLFSGIISQGKDMGVFLLNLIEHFRNLMIAKITHADPQLIDLPVDICQKLAEQSQAFSLEEIFSAFNILVNTQEISKRLDSLRIPLEITLVRLAHEKRGLNQSHAPSTTSYVTKPTPAVKEKQAVRLVKEEEVDDSVPLGHVQSTSLDNVKSVWKNIIDSLAKIKMSVATYLNEGEPERLENNILTVSFPMNYSLHKESLERKENKATIEKVVSGLLNANIKVNFTLSKKTVEKDNSESDPFIKSALETFNGRVVKGQ